MSATVSLVTVRPRLIAAVHRCVTMAEMASTWRPALDQVWQFLRTQPGLRTDGHNLFLYHHPAHRDAPMEIDFGVEVTRNFPPTGEVHLTETPAGEAAMAVHIGSYEGLRATHGAVQDWVGARRRAFAGWSWEIYGDWTEDLTKLETEVFYLLA